MSRRYERATGADADVSRTRATLVGLAVTAIAFLLYWLCNRNFEAGRGDFFYLADAFLHGRTWIDRTLGVNDVIDIQGRIYVPFAPFPALALMPLVALIGSVSADHIESGLNALLAASVAGLAWWVAGSIGAKRLGDRLMLVILLGFSTQVWWVTTRGGVWHTGHLVAMILTLLLLAEMFGRQRGIVMGLLVGAAFLSRAPLILVGPLLAMWVVPSWDKVLGGGHTLAGRLRALPWRAWLWLVAGVAPALTFFFWYNFARFGSPTESGYALATLPDWLERQRQQGLFAMVHLPMNIDYLFLKLPSISPQFPFIVPDGLGMSVLFTSPGLLLAVLAPWRDRRTWLLLGAAVLVLIPTMLYYGGGWFQFGYRYFLDSIPFAWAMVAMAAAYRGRLPAWGRALIWFGVVVMFTSVWWAYHM